MQDRLYIAIPTYNRRRIAELCIPTVRAGMADGDCLIVYDDGSQEKPWDSDAILKAATGFVASDSIGIDAQRRKHILEFWDNREIHGCNFLYLMDSDSPHDPDWRKAAMALHINYGAPVCLYRTQTHADYHKNIFKDDPNQSVIWQRFSPGVSLLLSLEQVARIANMIPERWSWDWHIAGLFGYKMAVSRVSYCCHIDGGGLHSPESGIGPEMATHPTDWLVKKREEILNELRR